MAQTFLSDGWFDEAEKIRAEIEPEVPEAVQGLVINLVVKDGPDGDIEAMAAAFHGEHERVYEHADPAAEVQIINLRLVVVGTARRPTMEASPVHEGTASASEFLHVHVDGKLAPVPFYERHVLLPGHSLEGPAIVAQGDSTTCLLPRMRARVDANHNLIIELEPTLGA